MSINVLAKKQWEWVEEVGWHNKTPLECLALIAEEVGEAIHECRGNLPTENLGVELADIILRTIDFAYDQEIDLDSIIEQKMATNKVNGTRGRVK